MDKGIRGGEVCLEQVGDVPEETGSSGGREEKQKQTVPRGSVDEDEEGGRTKGRQAASRPFFFYVFPQP